MSNPTNTVRLHRVLRASPERVYRAFLDPDAMAKWSPPHGFTGRVHHIDARVGGEYRMSFTNFSTGKSHSFGGRYTELVPHTSIKYTDRFEDPNLPGEIQVTISLRAVSCGTEVVIVQEGHARRWRREDEEHGSCERTRPTTLHLESLLQRDERAASAIPATRGSTAQPGLPQEALPGR